VLFYVLAQSTDAPFLFSNGQFQLLVEAMDAFQILGAEQFEQQGGDLREIAENAFYFGMKAVIFGALVHGEFRCEKQWECHTPKCAIGRSIGSFTTLPRG